MKSDFSFKQVAWVSATVLATLGALLLAWQFSGILAVLVFSLAVAAMTRAPVEWLVRHRVPRGIARMLIYVIGFATLLGIAWFVLPRIADEMRTFAGDLGEAYAGLQSRWTVGSDIQQSLMRSLPSPGQLNEVMAGQNLFGISRPLAELGILPY